MTHPDTTTPQTPDQPHPEKTTYTKYECKLCGGGGVIYERHDRFPYELGRGLMVSRITRSQYEAVTGDYE